MARIRDASVRESVEAADMVEVVSARTQLRRSGARWTGICPFHEEKTASFSVNPVEKLFYCFGCGKGGDIITFVRETEQLEFAEAVEWLAERYRVTLEYEESSPELDAERNRRERLLALLEQATAYYERCLWDSPRGESARTYLQSRALGEETCREYRLGLAPGGQSLARKAKEKGFSAAELSAAGLVNRRGNDYFSGRLLFPLADARGRVRGFQARKLREDDPLRAKYVNSPEGELFRKGSLLYGLDRARAAIAKQERAVVVEGNTDVLALRQAGLEPVVARRGGDPPRNGPCGRAGSRGEGRDPAAGAGPRRPGGPVRRAARPRRELPLLPRAAGDRAGARPAGGVRPRARGAFALRGLARAAGRRAAGGRPARPAEGDPGGPGARPAGQRHRRDLAAPARGRRAARARSSCRRRCASRAPRAVGRVGARALRLGAAPPSTRAPARAGRGRRRAGPAARGARRPRGRSGNR
ncbi:MAG: hypothetical protein E6G21_03865 [Actinobacteria bacterium]|nr:MAG: hypothetical protein E6G21_03865 [Actinomycetota bacterium]